MPADDGRAAVLIPPAALATLFLRAGFAGADDVAGDEKTRQDFKDDVKEWLQDTDEHKASSDEKAVELRDGYDALLRATTEHARVESGTRELSEAEVQDAIKYIIYETMKDESRKIARSESVTDAGFRESFGIQAAHASCPPTTSPSYLQASADISGGTVGGYALIIYSEFMFEGKNNLYDVQTYDNAITCERTYELYFHDEDHPYVDELYDDLRELWYGRIHDIESFAIRNNNQIIFDQTWSGSWGYADCGFACHKTTTKSYDPGQTIYVSNTWNHMMDTTNTNPSLGMQLMSP